MSSTWARSGNAAKLARVNPRFTGSSPGPAGRPPLGSGAEAFLRVLAPADRLGQLFCDAVRGGHAHGLDAFVDHLLIDLYYQGRVAGDRIGQAQGLPRQFAEWDHTIDEPNLIRTASAQRF